MTDSVVTSVADLARAVGADIGALQSQTGGVSDIRASQSAMRQALADLLARITAPAAASVAVQAAAGGAITLDGLSGLPQPRLIEGLDYEAILSRRKAKFVELATAAGLPGMADYLVLESAPETILLEDASYSELMLRDRINEVYRSRLLYFGTGTDVDYTADEYGVARLPGELDPDLKTRVRLKNRGSSSAGPDDWWKFWAKTADARVQDVAVTRSKFPYPAPGEQRGDVTIWVLANTADGVPSDDILANVRAMLSMPSIRGTTTRVIVKAATAPPVTLTADVWLLPDAQPLAFDGLEAKFRAAYAAERGLGFSVVASWLAARLMQTGIRRVELIDWADVVVEPFQAPLLVSVNLRLAGRTA